MLSRIVEDETFKFWLETEIEKQSDFYICCAQVIEQLRFMCGVERAHSLKFQQHTFIDQYICCKISDLLTAKPNWNLNLAMNIESC